MIRNTTVIKPPALEPTSGQPELSGEQWLGRNATPNRRLRERLNARHRKQLHILARALVLRQAQAHLPEPERAKLAALLGDFERLAARMERLLWTMALRTPPIA